MNELKKLLLLLLFPCVLLTSVSVRAETGLQGFDGITKSITALDMKRGIITVGEKQFKFDSNTVITNFKGEKVSADNLRQHEFVTIRLNTAQRFLNYPLLSEMRIETGDGDD